jgi:hypothetical protein
MDWAAEADIAAMAWVGSAAPIPPGNAVRKRRERNAMTRSINSAVDSVTTILSPVTNVMTVSGLASAYRIRSLFTTMCSPFSRVSSIMRASLQRCSINRLIGADGGKVIDGGVKDGSDFLKSDWRAHFRIFPQKEIKCTSAGSMKEVSTRFLTMDALEADSQAFQVSRQTGQGAGGSQVKPSQQEPIVCL